jgi:hypothetical protein
MWRDLCACLALIMAVAGPALADDSGMNKEGYWIVGRGDADAKSCMASISDADETMLLIQVAPGHVDFAVGKKEAMRRGRKGVVTIDAQSFDFHPDFTDEGMLFFEDAGAHALAAMRGARGVVVQVDGREVLNRSVEKTGLEGALDAVVACSKGESGWWGPGVGAARPKPAINKENVWFLERSNVAGAAVCTAYALADKRTLLVLIGASGEIGLGIKSDDDIRRGRKGLLEADSTAVAFKPMFDGARYFSSDESFDASALAAIRNAKSLRISIDGRAAADVIVEGTGLPALLDDLAACSKGQAGWWGEGAAKAP